MNYNLDCPDFLLDNIEYLKDSPSIADLQAIESEGLTLGKISLDFKLAILEHRKQNQKKLFDFVKEYEADNLFVMQDPATQKNQFVHIAKTWKSEARKKLYEKSPSQQHKAKLEAELSLAISKRDRQETKSLRQKLKQHIKEMREL